MKKVRLIGFKKSLNSEEYRRLLEVTGGLESPYYAGEDALETLEEINNLDIKVTTDLGRQRGYIISKEEARRLRYQEISEKIARDRGF